MKYSFLKKQLNTCQKRAMNKRLLISYFENFGKRSINASKEVVIDFLKNNSLNIDIDSKELKVSWIEIVNEIDKIENSDFDWFVLCGEASTYQDVTIEVHADNICKGIDKYGVEGISDNPYEEFFTSFDIEKLKIDNVNISYNAGSYLCNRSYFLSLKKFRNKKVLFIHFPLIKEEGGNKEKTELSYILERIIERIDIDDGIKNCC